MAYCPQRIYSMMERVFLEVSSTYPAKINKELSPPLIWKLCHFSLNIDTVQ